MAIDLRMIPNAAWRRGANVAETAGHEAMLKACALRCRPILRHRALSQPPFYRTRSRFRATVAGRFSKKRSVRRGTQRVSVERWDGKGADQGLIFRDAVTGDTLTVKVSGRREARSGQVLGYLSALPSTAMIAGRLLELLTDEPGRPGPGEVKVTDEVGRVHDERAAEALNRAADDLLAVAERAARAATRRGDEIDATLAQIRMLRAAPAP
jgi:hypothetical protein